MHGLRVNIGVTQKADLDQTVYSKEACRMFGFNI
jgi:hypothetical protein